MLRIYLVEASRMVAVAIVMGLLIAWLAILCGL
jgi:hypothetical protein